MSSFLSNFVGNYDSVLFRDFEFSVFGWIRISFACSALIILIFSLFHLIFFSGIYRKKLELLQKTSKQYYNSHLKIYSKMYIFLALIQVVIAVFEVSELVGHSVINSNLHILDKDTTNKCVIHEFTTMAALKNTKFLLLLPPITPNLVYPLLLTLVYSFLMFTAKMFALEHTKRKRYLYTLHVSIWGTIQVVFLLILYSNAWTLIAAPFVFTIFVLIDLILFLYYAFYLRNILKKSCKDTTCYTDNTADIRKITRFYQAYNRGMIILVIAFLVLSFSLVLTALFDGVRSFYMNNCFYKFYTPEAGSTSDDEVSKILIIAIILLKFLSMMFFDLFVIASCSIICVKVVSFYKELCLVSKQQSTRPLMSSY